MRDYCDGDAVPLTVPFFFRRKQTSRYRNDNAFSPDWTWRFRAYKYLFDKTLAVLGLVVASQFGGLLLFLHPFLNPGPLFYRQERYGKDKKSFVMWKFRTMLPEDPGQQRGATCGLETGRITILGAALRKYRIDELPNFLNVLLGQMSVIGPRPDIASHACHYCQEISHYNYRFKIKPGITGLAQIESGYAEGIEATARKAHFDRIYVQSSCTRMDAYIALRTIGVMISGFGAK
ncbi:MAG: sugar transferase [Pseudorhodobacter sp.]